jgi:hypothetical protein
MADKTYTPDDLTTARAALIRAKNHGHRYAKEAEHYRTREAHFRSKAEYCEGRVPEQMAERDAMIARAKAKVEEIQAALK